MDPDEGQDNTGVVAEEPQGIEVEETSDSTGINPAWNELLSSLPSSLHSQVTPHLTKWDQNFQSKIGEVHSQYEPYKPFVEKKVDPEQINYALQVLQRIEENPEEVLKALQDYIGGDEEQGLQDTNGVPPDQPEINNDDLPEFAQHPQWQRMEQMVNQIAQHLVQQRESQYQEEADEQFEADWNAAKQTHGEFDEDWVLSKLLQDENLTVDQAVQSFKTWEAEKEKALLQKIRQPGPPVLGNGGSVPQGDFNPAKLPEKERRNLVAQMLAQSKDS